MVNIDTGFCLVDVDDRHAVDGAALVLDRSGVDNIVGPDDDGNVNGGDGGVNVIHLAKLLVRNISLSKENVHVPRHTPCDGVNGVANFAAVLLQDFTEFLDGMLCLGDGEAVTGNEDNAGCGLKGLVGVLD